jgi:hypothetical protein
MSISILIMDIGVNCRIAASAVTGNIITERLKISTGTRLAMSIATATKATEITDTEHDVWI